MHWENWRNVQAFRKLCWESGICVGGSLSGVITRKRFNRSVRVHKIILESLERATFLEQFVTKECAVKNWKSTKELLALAETSMPMIGGV